MSGLDLDDIGLSFDDLDLDGFDVPHVPYRHRRQPKGWWTTSEAEEFFYDMPPFRSGAERARYLIGDMTRAALANIEGATNDDPLFEHEGRMVSANDLVASIDSDAVDALKRIGGV